MFGKPFWYWCNQKLCINCQLCVESVAIMTSGTTFLQLASWWNIELNPKYCWLLDTWPFWFMMLLRMVFCFILLSNCFGNPLLTIYCGKNLCKGNDRTAVLSCFCAFEAVYFTSTHITLLPRRSSALVSGYSAFIGFPCCFATFYS